MNNQGNAFEGRATIRLGGMPTCSEELGLIPQGNCTNTVLIPDIAAPTVVIVELFDKSSGQSVAK